MPNAVTVLVVDDDTSFLESISILLAQENITCITAPDGETGLSEIMKKKPDVAIVDLDMPIMNGIEFARYIREHELGVPVIIISGHSPLELPAEINTAGIHSFIQKPMRIVDIVLAIQNAISSAQ
ncbi:MAG: response regulator [Bacteroidota bacterium]